jgi:hypothetical protein
MKVKFGIKKFVATVLHLPPEISVLIRGDHGIGKSQIIAQVAQRLNLPLIDRRLSQTSEGDLIGLPTTNEGSTSFLPVDWFVRACREPVVLFLDELNRASNEVMQAAFQIVLDRELNGHSLHPETRVFCAINSSGKYNVNTLDPALLDRFWTCDLQPSVDEWIEASRASEVHPHIVTFIHLNPKWLDAPEKLTDDSVTPSRRSWWRLSDAIGNIPDLKSESDKVYDIALGFVGVEAAIAFVEHVKRHESRCSPEDVLTQPAKFVKLRPGMNISDLNELTDSLALLILKGDSVSPEKCGNVKIFFDTLPGELKVSFWSKITSGGTPKKNIIAALHKELAEELVAVFTPSKK